MKFSYHNSQLDPKQIESAVDAISLYFPVLKTKLATEGYDDREDLLLLCSDQKTALDVAKLCSSAELREAKLLIIVGIGGSNLGTWALTAAIGTSKEIVYVETVSGSQVKNALDAMHYAYERGETAALIAISKSGTTTETVANLAIILERFQKHDNQWQSRTIFITDEGSSLWSLAEKLNVLRSSLPKAIGGRFSVFSSVGLIPLTLAGLDIGSLLQGAREQEAKVLNPDWHENDALHSAAILYTNYKQGRKIHNTFIFEPVLAMLGQWYRQLSAESLGKHHRGLTPLISIGSTDLHSMLQLYLGGTEDKFTTFLSVAMHKQDYTVPATQVTQALLPELAGKSLADVMQAILTGVQGAYLRDAEPFVHIELESINEHELGQLLMFKMMETLYLAQMLGVNAFDQPEVEGYKQETRAILAQL